VRGRWGGGDSRGQLLQGVVAQPPACMPAHLCLHTPRCSNNTQPCTELFCPIYSLGASPDPLRAAATARRRLLQAGGKPEPEIYMAVGLDSGERLSRAVAVQWRAEMLACKAVWLCAMCRWFCLPSLAGLRLCMLSCCNVCTLSCCNVCCRRCCARCAGIQASEFKRKRLNLIILLDVSGSMGSPFDQYYYDQLGEQKNLTAAGEWRCVAC
jgi:hypothetical protein